MSKTSNKSKLENLQQWLARRGKESRIKLYQFTK